MKQPAVYIMANRRNGALYVGVTSNLVRRVHEHKTGIIKGFTEKYHCHLLVLFEIHPTMESAIIPETKLKDGSRKRKIQLIEDKNPKWNDLYENIV